MTTISENLGIPVDQQDYVSGTYTPQYVDWLIKEGRIQNRAELQDIWKEEHCDPLNWHYKPNTYGVEGAHLTGTPVMMLWEETEAVEEDSNIGRAVFDEVVEVNKLVYDIQSRGICPREGSIVYFDVAKNRTVNGTHRRRASEILGIAGWMMQGIRFDTELARIRFALLSNARVEGLPHNNASKEDVKNSVHLIMDELCRVRPIGKKDIVKEVKALGHHLSEATRDDIRDALFAELIVSGEMPSANVLVNHNNTTIERTFEIGEYALTEVEKLSRDDRDPWIKDYYENDDEICLIINVKNFQQRVGSILATHAIAKSKGKAMHFLYTVSVQDAGKESLLSKRQKFFSTFLRDLEDHVLTVISDIPYLNIGEDGRKLFAWNHPDAKHRAVPQDTKNEVKNRLVYVPNRGFN